MNGSMYIKTSFLLVPTCILICTSNLFLNILALGWIPASYLLAKKWRCRIIDRIAKTKIIKRILDA